MHFLQYNQKMVVMQRDFDIRQNNKKRLFNLYLRIQIDILAVSNEK